MVVTGSDEVCFCPQWTMWHFVLPVTFGAPDHQYHYNTHAIHGGLSRSLCPQSSTHMEKTFELAQSWKSICCCCSVIQSYLTLWDPIDCSMPGLPVPHQLPEFAQVHVHCIGDDIQPSHLLTPSSTSAFYLSQQQGLFQ